MKVDELINMVDNMPFYADNPAHKKVMVKCLNEFATCDMSKYAKECLSLFIRSGVKQLIKKG